MDKMIAVLKENVSDDEVESLIQAIKKINLTPYICRGDNGTTIVMAGDKTKVDRNYFENIEIVEKIIHTMAPYKLASRDFHPDNSVIDIKGVKIGGKEIAVIAGPCSVESEEQFYETAEAVKKAGAKIVRAMLFKPRTGPYSFQGLGVKGFKIIKKISEELNLLTETEVMDSGVVGELSKYTDILHVGARNMQNFDLLKEVGKSKKPVILKNGLCSTMDEFLLAAEYIMNEGNEKVILCHRGVREYEPELRFPLNLELVPLIKKQSHLPIIVDPSHAAGRRDLIIPMSKAAIAAGADGLLVEVHRNPNEAVSDSQQQIDTKEFSQLCKEISRVAKAVDRQF